MRVFRSVSGTLFKRKNLVKTKDKKMEFQMILNNKYLFFMGKYLTTNLNITAEYSKEWADERREAENVGLQEIPKEFIGDLTLYNFKEHEACYIWELKPEILLQNLSSFLKRYYLDIYGVENYYSKNIEKILTTLERTNTLQEILSLGKERNLPFSYEDSPDYSFYGPPRREFHIHHFQLSSEGKVNAEIMHGHLKFFTNLIRHKYSDNPLGSCMSVNIYG